MNPLNEAERLKNAILRSLDNAAEEGPDPLLDLIPIAVYLCDQDGAVLRYNKAASNLWQFSPKPGHALESLCTFHRPSDQSTEPTPMAEVVRSGHPIKDEEIVIERANHSRVTVLASIEPLKDSEGQIVGTINCLVDITEYRRSRNLHDHQRHSYELLKGLPIAVYTTDALGRLTFYNEAAVALWGRRPSVGDETWCGSWKLYWPDGTPMAHSECPMAKAIKNKRAISGAEAIAERPDGTRVPFLAHPTPLFDEAGELVGAINALVDVSSSKDGEEARFWLASIVESSHDAIISRDLNGIITSWNKGAEQLFGYRAEEIVGQPITPLIPLDRREEEPAILERIRHGERVDHYETVRQRKDGSLVDISLTVSPVRNAKGTIVGMSKIARDITERRRTQERQVLLLREMNHRVKNLFTLTGGIVALSARSAGTAAELAATVRDRLSALARAHDLTLRRDSDGSSAVSQSTTLDALMRTIVSPYDNTNLLGQRSVVTSGPEISIGGKMTTNFALLLHEFTTNSAKYGALSTANGQVLVEWSALGDELTFTWREFGGPPIMGPPGEEGFGSMIAKATIEGQLGGRISRDWAPEGLIIRLSIPLSRLAL